MKATTKHPLIGAGLHFKLPNGYVNEQAEIIDIVDSDNVNVGKLVLIEYFNWIMGEATIRRLIPLIELASTQWVFYASTADMNSHYESVDQYRNEQIAAKEGNDPL